MLIIQYQVRYFTGLATALSRLVIMFIPSGELLGESGYYLDWLVIMLLLPGEVQDRSCYLSFWAGHHAHSTRLLLAIGWAGHHQVRY